MINCVENSRDFEKLACVNVKSAWSPSELLENVNKTIARLESLDV